MQTKTNFLLLFFLFSTVFSYSQSSTISGFVHDKESGEKLISAVVYNLKTGSHVLTNNYGFYSLKCANSSNLQISYVGYQISSLEINCQKDTLINIYLNPNNSIEEVAVSANRTNILDTEIGVINIDLNLIRKLPSLGGETDVIKSLQLLPGIQSGNEGTTGLYVRGGGADQNLFLLDGVPLYNISHLFGFMSIFNDDAISSMKVIKGGFPAQYGGRLSSVIDIRMKEGNLNKFSGNASVGFISSKVELEGPLQKGKSSFLVSARRTYVDAFTKSVSYFSKTKEEPLPNYYFYDFSTKLNYKFSNKNRIYLSLFLGNDNFSDSYKNETEVYTIQQNSLLSWGSKLASFRHNYMLNKKIFLNTSLYYSYYQLANSKSFSYEDNENSIYNQTFKMQYSSQINDFGIISDLDFYFTDYYSLKAGVNGIRHSFLPGVKISNYTSGIVNSVNTNSGGKEIPANEFRIYAENKLTLWTKLQLNLGIHASLFNVQQTTYNSIEPRFSVNLKLFKSSAIKASYSEMQQYLHLLTNAGFGLPTDLWVPPTAKISPQKAKQVSLGFYQKLPYDLSFSMESYFKKMSNMIAYKDNSSYFIETQDWDSNVLNNGNGKSYGAEFFINKNWEKVQFWLGYTFSRTTRQFDALNNGKEYSYKYDRTHDISLSFLYKINDNITVSANWVYGTGNAVSVPVAVYPSILYPGNSGWGYAESNNGEIPLPVINYRTKTEVFDYGERNGQRLPSYHRLDVSFSFTKQKKYWERTFKLGLYNAYNRTNPYYLTYAYSNDGFGNYDTNGEFRIVSLLPILPGVSYSIKF